MLESNLRRVFRCKKQNLKPILSSLVLFSLLVGLGGAAYTNNYSNTSSGTLELNRGFYLGIGLEGAEEYTESLETQNMSSGSSFGLDFVMQNRANDRSQPAVEILTLDSEESLTWRELESFNTMRENNSGYSREHTLKVDAKGMPSLKELYRNGTAETFSQEISDNAGEGFGVTNTDIDSDSLDEILVCISENEGRRYSSNETWNGNIEIDTKTSFPAKNLRMEYRLVGLYNPETGTHPSIVRECPQIS
jgi:hypothetical protein